MIGLLLICFAGCCKAIMDTLEHHWHVSVFSKLNQFSFLGRFFGEEAWRNKYINGLQSAGRKKWKILWTEFNKPVQVCDGWHFFNMLRVIAWVGAVVLFKPIFKDAIYMDFITVGYFWNYFFTILYGRDVVSNPGLLIKAYKVKDGEHN